MNIEKMKQCIKAAYHARQPVMIWGKERAPFGEVIKIN